MEKKRAALKEIYERFIDRYGPSAEEILSKLLIGLEKKDKIKAADLIEIESTLRQQLVGLNQLRDSRSSKLFASHVRSPESRPLSVMEAGQLNSLNSTKTCLNWGSFEQEPRQYIGKVELNRVSDWGELTRLKHRQFIEENKDIEARKKSEIMKYRTDLLRQAESRLKERKLHRLQEPVLPLISDREIAKAEHLEQMKIEAAFYKKAKEEQAEISKEKQRLISNAKQADADAIKAMEQMRIKAEMDKLKYDAKVKNDFLTEQRHAIQSVESRKRKRFIVSREAAMKQLQYQMSCQESSLKEEKLRKLKFVEKTCAQFMRQVGPDINNKSSELDSIKLKPESKLYRSTLDIQIENKRKAEEMRRKHDLLEGIELKVKAEEELKDAVMIRKTFHSKSQYLKKELDQQVKDKEARLINKSRMNSRELSFQKSWIDSLYLKPSEKGLLNTSSFL